MKIKLDKFMPATTPEILNVESELGFRFPEDYRTFLLTYNGAIPEDNILDENPNIGIERFIPLADILKRSSQIDGFPKNAWPIAQAQSGNYFYLNKSSVEVFFWDHEIEGDKNIAASFDEFLQKLKPLDIDSFHLKPEHVISVWIAPGFKPKFS